MLPSRYLRVVPSPTPGRSVLFSTRNACLTVVPAELGSKLLEGEVPQAWTETLGKLGFAVSDPAAELREAQALLDDMNRVRSELTVAVILGLGCNFACPYCYERAAAGPAAMSEETAERTVALLRGLLGAQTRRLTLDFYGGEPLLYLPLLERIAAPLRSFAEERGVEFRFTLVTNGSLLTPEVVRRLLPLGLSGAKVTLDGPPENHDRSRPFRSGQGTFETVVANVRACCELLPIGVGGNFTPESWPLFPKLLDLLEALGLGPERLAQVKFDPVLRSASEAAGDLVTGCASLAEPWLVEPSLRLREEVVRRGYRTPRIHPTPCMADLDDAFTVHCDGALYKCPAVIGLPGYAAGNVRDGFSPYRELYGGERWRADEQCLECGYLPLCFGGCRYMQLQATGAMAGVQCGKAFWNAALDTLVRQDETAARRRKPPLS